MVFITGDTHIPIDVRKLTVDNFAIQDELSRDDYVIICGDFGAIWNDSGSHDRNWLDWLEGKNFTTLFVDGNHENFDLLERYDVSEWNGGKVHRIRNHIYHLMRSQVFTIDDRKIFTMGGGTSIDREYRVAGRTWWEREMPNDDEYQEAFDNLSANNNAVDCIITHSAPTSVMVDIDPSYHEDKLNNFLEFIKDHIRYDKWYFGHYHVDRAIDEKHRAIYDDIIEYR